MIVYSGLTKDQLRETIRLVRRFRPLVDGHRRFDLVRTGKALSACASVGMKYMTIFPLPLKQKGVMNNTTIFPQKPGNN